MLRREWAATQDSPAPISARAGQTEPVHAHSNTGSICSQRQPRASVMQTEYVIHLLECVFADLPVGIHAYLPGRAAACHLGKGVALKTFPYFAQVFFQGFLWRRVRINKNKALPGINGNSCQPERFFLDAIEILFVWNRAQRAIPRVSLLRPKKVCSSVLCRSEPSRAYGQPWNLHEKV